MKDLLQSLREAFPKSMVSIDTNFDWHASQDSPCWKLRFYIGDHFYSSNYFTNLEDLSAAITDYINLKCPTRSLSSTEHFSSTTQA